MNYGVRGLKFCGSFCADSVDHLWLELDGTFLLFLVSSIVQKLEHRKLVVQFIERAIKQLAKLVQHSTNQESHSNNYTIFLQQFIQSNQLYMKPARPDSAKSAKTRITIDSQATSNNITQSRFSETYSNGVKYGAKKEGSDFEKYVAEKDKDPKFKRLLQPQLPQIPEQVKPATEISKLNSKPFEKKLSKNDKEKHEKKIEEPTTKLQKQTKPVKKQNNLQSSKTFMDKSKQKLKIPSKQQINDNQNGQKIEEKNTDMEPSSKPEANKAKINLNGFVLNVPGKPPQVIKQQKIQQKETEDVKQKRQRQKIMTEISDFVQQMEQKNSRYMPNWYDEFIEKNSNSKDVDLNKIQIGDYLNEPNEHDYDKLMKKINQNQNRLRGEDSLSSSQISVNLEQIIEQSGLKNGTKEERGDDDDASVIMSSMSASDIRERNMFLTQILKGKRITKEQMSQIKQNEETMMKLIKLEGASKEQQFDSDAVQVVEINMSKKKNNKIMERNKIEAGGELYRECDLLTPEEQQRIEDLINGVKIQSPFELNEMQHLISRRIDEGIKLHRQLCQSIEGNNSSEPITIDEETLPKDPNLRKKAELNLLRERLNSVNSRLASVNQIVINSTKIQNLVKKYKEVVKPSKNGQNLIKEKNKQIEEQCQQLREAELILQKAEDEKQEILKILEDVTIKFSNMSADVIRIQNMDSEELRKMEQNKLQQKRIRVLEIENEAKQFESEIQSICYMREELKRRVDMLDQIMGVSNNQMKCQGYEQGETIENLDALITKKWQAAEEAVRNIPI